MTSPVKIWRNQKKLVVKTGKVGNIISWTVIRVPPEGFGYQAPYPVALVKLESGERVLLQMVDYRESDLKTGQKVVTVLRRTREPKEDEVIPYGIKVKPV